MEGLTSRRTVIIWVHEHKHRVVELDVNYVGKLEQGVIRWLQDPDRRRCCGACWPIRGRCPATEPIGARPVGRGHDPRR